MKITKSAVLIVLLSVAALYLTSCKDKKEILVRTWKVEDIQQEVEPVESQKATIEAFKKNMRDSFELSYAANGTYKSSFKGNEITGTWKLNYNSTSLDVVTSTNEKKTFKIKELNKDKFIFVAPMQSGNITYVMIPKQ